MLPLPPNTPSFSVRQKWRIGVQVTLVTATVLCVVIMLNYLSHDLFHRFHLSSQTAAQLSPRTVEFLKTLTNNVTVTLYYDRKEPMFSTISELLNQYALRNSRISVQTVDYLHDPGAAQKIKTQYKLGSLTDKNVVIFDCEHRIKILDGKTLTDYAPEQSPGQREFRSRPVAFKGEMAFTGGLLAVTSNKRLKACFLTGHGEHRLESTDEVQGYFKFGTVMANNFIEPRMISLLGTNIVPMDCNLLVVAGPTAPIPVPELEKIEQYLAQGGRLLALFKYESLKRDSANDGAESLKRESGLEKTLASWGVDVGANVVKDPDNTVSGSDVIIDSFGHHPVVDPLANESRLQLFLPSTVSRLAAPGQPADAPRVSELAFTGPKSFISGDPNTHHSYTVMVAVEKGAIKGVATERGTTRILVVGDSLFLANRQIDSAGNRDFADYALNWLLDRPQLLVGLGPKPLTEYRLTMTHRQLQSTQILLLAGMPGSVLLLGGIVWLRRRR